MENYKGNSLNSREPQRTQKPEEKKVQSVVTGNVTIKKKSGVQKFFESFIQEDLHKVKEYAIRDVIVPKSKQIILDIVNNGLSLLFFGEVNHKTKQTLNGQRVSYAKFYGDQRNSGYSDVQKAQPARPVFDFDNIVLDSRADAEQVLMQLDELISTYGHATVADLYDSLSITSTNHCDNNYGWYNLSSASTKLTQGGYKLVLPRVVPINQ